MSIEKATLVDFLDALALEVQPLTSVLLLEGCSVNIVGDVKTSLEHHGYQVLFNLPYGTDPIGIEHFWGLAKQRYQTQLLRRLLDGAIVDLPTLAQDAIEAVSKAQEIMRAPKID